MTEINCYNHLIRKMLKVICLSHFLLPIDIGIIQGHNRTQFALFPVSLDDSFGPDNEVRIIDLFVDSLSVKYYGFRTDYVENGSLS